MKSIGFILSHITTGGKAQTVYLKIKFKVQDNVLHKSLKKIVCVELFVHIHVQEVNEISLYL